MLRPTVSSTRQKDGYVSDAQFVRSCHSSGLTLGPMPARSASTRFAKMRSRLVEEVEAAREVFQIDSAVA